MSDSLQDLLHARGPIKIIGVVGMGYVGIPSAVLFANSDQYNQVIGFQRDSLSSGYKIDLLNRGQLPLLGEEPGLEDMLKKVVKEKKFSCTGDFSQISRCDAVTLAIQTPFKNSHDLIPDFSALEEGIRFVGRYLTPGTLVVLESTITPGTTTGYATSLLEEESGLKAGKDFALAHAPERVMVGRLLRNIQEHDRIVGGIDEQSTIRAVELYRPVLTKGTIIPMSATAAEVTKTAENTFRDLQIAAANQLALYCEAMGINFYDVRTGVDSLKGDGITRAILWPGVGVGGHCLTKDTYHLERGIEVAGVRSLDFPEGKDSLYVLARQINDFMPQHMFNLTVDAFKRIGKDIRHSKIAMLGWSFLPNTDDTRNTPAQPLAALIQNEGARLMVHDPWVSPCPEKGISQNFEEVLDDADGILLVTGHSCYHNLNPDLVREITKKDSVIIIDGRNIIQPDDWIKRGYIYEGIGRGDKNNHPLKKL